MPIEKDPLPNQSVAITRLKQRVRGVDTETGRLIALNYQPRPTDVLLATGAKCGTTWMQQICHQLRWAQYKIQEATVTVPAEDDDDDDETRLIDTLKEMPLEFKEMNEVVPWMEVAYDCGQNIEDEQPYGQHVRFFKSHFWAVHCPGPFHKTIVVIRDPVAILPSFYRFFENWFFPAGDVTLEEFGLEFWLQRGFPENRMQNAGYFAHLISWYKEFVTRVIDGGDRSSMIFVFFEDLKEDHEREVTRIARFLSTDKINYCTNAIISLVVERSSFDFMKKNEGCFDGKFVKLSRNKACGLPPDAGMYHSKISHGDNGKNRAVLTERILAEIDRQWKTAIQSETGFVTYEDLHQQFKRWREEGKSM